MNSIPPIFHYPPKRLRSAFTYTPSVVKTPISANQDDYYFLELFFSVGQLMGRGIFGRAQFGQAKMDKETLDHRIRSYLKAELDNDFSALVQQYLKKEQLMENWLNEQGST